MNTEVEEPTNNLLEELAEIDPTKSAETETENTPLYCHICSWKTHAGAKDKERGLKNHIKQKHPEEQIKKKSYSRKKKIEISPPNIEEITDDLELIGEDDDTKRLKIIGDLDLLQLKFTQIDFNWNYNNNSSLCHLKRQKALFLRVLNDQAGTDAIFNLLVISSQALEKVADVSSIVNIDGYSQDVKENKAEIYPILKNMVDTGVLDVGHLSPELRLGMIMASLAINRLNHNKINKNNFLDETAE
tara:strand:+ start:974 stop:1708 length:735 start_codon:yes stop_codon:yes gene_type:complete